MSDFPLHPASPSAALTTPFRYRLSTRIVTLSGVALALVLSMIAGTLWLSWQLEGAGAAINDAGSLRMRAGNVAIQLNEARAGLKADVSSQNTLLDLTLAHLKSGDPARPLFLPATPAIHATGCRIASLARLVEAGDHARFVKLSRYPLALSRPAARYSLPKPMR